MRHVAIEALALFDWATLAYFVAANSGYLILLVLAGGSLARYLRRLPIQGRDDAISNPFSPGISIVVPAYNEEAVIVESVRAMLALRYPRFEVVVVVDGATDGTLDELTRAFDLTEVERVVPTDIPVRGKTRAVLVPRGTAPLAVLVKENSGRADSLNAGANLASEPLVCMVDADSILDPEALLRVAQPFLDDPERVVASGGVVRPVNGCEVMLGRVVDVRMPRDWVSRIQAVEYLRAFMMGRTGWSVLNSLLVISGAFGLFRRDVLVEAGGLDATCIGEDAELVVRLHRRMRDAKRPYRIVFVAEPVSWTEVPSTRAVLARQRRRWARGLAEILWRHRSMIGNPRYGRIGLVALPYFVIFELLAPIIELVGVVAVVVGLALGAINLAFAGAFLLVAVLYAFVLSLAALTLEEIAFHRSTRWSDLAVALGAAMLENLSFRQRTAVWRVQGTWAAMRGHSQEWGEMTRVGFGQAAPHAELPRETPP